MNLDNERLGKEITAKAIAERNKRIEEYWDNLLPFREPKDVPPLPKVDAKKWKEFYVPKIIKANGIPRKDLVDGQFYIGDHRNANVAKWDAKKEHFVYMRYKFGSIFEDVCKHFEDDDGFALFVPLRIATEEQYKQNKIE